MITLNVPLNSVSFGQLSVAILRELHRRGEEVSIMPIGQVDVSSQTPTQEFGEFLKKSLSRFPFEHSRENPIFRLWHLTPDSLSSFSRQQNLLSFYELDAPTPLEVNIAKNQDTTYFTSHFAIEQFVQAGVPQERLKYLPLFFDTNHFKKVDVKYPDDRIVFGLVGKWEKRKHHAKILKAWVKKFGDRRDVFLNCAISNPHYDQNRLNAEIYHSLEGKKYFNVNFLGHMKENALYNHFLNSNHIVIAMSGGEGWGLPEFQSVALGKYCVGMPVNGYAEWMNAENTVQVDPCGKIPAYDNVFFKEGNVVNQGNLFDFDEEEFIVGCEKAIELYKNSSVNEAGLLLPDRFPISTTVDIITNDLQKLKE